MAQGFGGFDTTYYGPTYTEDIEAIEKGMQQGLQIGANIQQARIQNAKQQADLDAQKQRDIANQMALDKMDGAVREGLILSADSKSDNLNDARVDFSNMLVDKFNQLKIARDEGSITSGDYSKAIMTLQAQIPAYKAAEKVMYGGVEQYMDALQEGKLSDSNDPEAIEFWSAISRGDAEVSYKVGNNGRISLDGTWTDSNGNKKPISAELAEMDRLPFVSTKPETTVKDQLAADVKNILSTKEGNAMRVFNQKTGQYETNYYPIHNDDGSLTPWFKQFAEESFDSYFTGLGKGDKRKALKEYLMDSVEISDRKVLMDQLAGFGGAESYGIKTLDDLLKNKSITDINNFINSNIKVNWLEQSKNAVLEGNKNLIASSNQANQKAQLELRKDIADTRKAEFQAEKARKELSSNGKDDKIEKEMSFLLDTMNSDEFRNLTKDSINFSGSYDTKGQGKKEDFANALTGGLSGDIQKDKDIFNLFGIDLSGTVTDEKGDVIQYEPVGGGKIRFDTNKGFGETLIDILRYKGYSQQDAEKTVKNTFKLIDKEVRPQKWISSTPTETYKNINF